MSKHDSDSCLNCLHSFRTKNKPEPYKKVCENNDFCNFIMLSEDTKILQFNHYQKPGEIPFIIYPNLESFIEKTDGYKKNPEKSSVTKVFRQVFQCLQYCHLKK